MRRDPRQAGATILLWCGILCVSGCESDKSVVPTVRVAASFYEAAERVLGSLRGQSVDAQPVAEVVPAASSRHARQIAAGAEPDCFVSAHVEWMDFLQKRDLLVPGTRRALVKNTLVIVAPRGRKQVLDWDRGLFVMGDPSHVPAGKYGRQALEKLGVWSRVQPRAVFATSVRHALAMVEHDEVEFGIVYDTDARISNGVQIVHRFQPGQVPEIRYEIARIRGGGEDIYNRLTSDAAKAVYRELGFLVVNR